MATCTLDINQSTLDALAQIRELSTELRTFIKGDADQTVVTDAGPIGSLAKIKADIEATRFVQRVKDKETHAAMLAATDIEVGMIVRIFDDPTPANNGIWLLESESPDVFVKQEYIDLLDLNILPEDVTHLNTIYQKALGTVTGTAATPGLTYFANVNHDYDSAFHTTTIEVEYSFTSDEVGNAGAIVGKKIFTMVSEGSLTHYEGVQAVSEIKLGDFSVSGDINFILEYQDDGPNTRHRWSIRVTAPNDIQTGTLEVTARSTDSFTALSFGDAGF